MCMPGVDEKYWNGDRKNREKTFFYEWYVANRLLPWTVSLISLARSTSKDDDDDDEKRIDQPEKRDSRGRFETHNGDRDDLPRGPNNNTFEGKIGNYILQGKADGTLNTAVAGINEVTTQGLPDS